MALDHRALCSLVVFPNLESIQLAFPNVDPSIINDDLAYPAMLSFVPHGWLGLILASPMAAYMSTISTHLNWGSSYVVNDFYKRFVKPEAEEKELVLVGRISTVLMMVVAAFLALQLSNSLQAFNIMLQIGAGTGLLFILRWFWWRINAISELTAMVVSFVIAVGFEVGKFELESWQKLVIGVAVTTVCWVVATLLSSPTEAKTLREFCKKTHPGGPGWKHVYAELKRDGEVPAADSINLPRSILCMVAGCLAVYAFLFSVGSFLYGNMGMGAILGAVSVGGFSVLFALWEKVNAS